MMINPRDVQGSGSSDRGSGKAPLMIRSSRDYERPSRIYRSRTRRFGRDVVSGLLRLPPTAGGGNGFRLFPDPDARLFDSRFSSVRQDSPVTWLPSDPNRGFEISLAVRKVQWLHRFITELALDWEARLNAPGTRLSVTKGAGISSVR